MKKVIVKCLSIVTICCTSGQTSQHDHLDEYSKIHAASLLIKKVEDGYSLIHEETEQLWEELEETYCGIESIKKRIENEKKEASELEAECIQEMGKEEYSKKKEEQEKLEEKGRDTTASKVAPETQKIMEVVEKQRIITRGYHDWLIVSENWFVRLYIALGFEKNKCARGEKYREEYEQTLRKMESERELVTFGEHEKLSDSIKQTLADRAKVRK